MTKATVRLPALVVVALGTLSVPAVGQSQVTSRTVAFFAATAANPATETPIAAPVVYPVALVSCDQAKVAEAPPITNPSEGRLDDPAAVTRDCVLPLQPQVAALPAGTYRGAMRSFTGATPGAWSLLTTPFSVTAQVHPCDAAPVASATVTAGARTLRWCTPDVDVPGNPVAITGWMMEVDGVKAVLGGVTVGATTNTAGQRNYSAVVTVSAGTRVLRLFAVNAQGEAGTSPTLTVTVTSPLGPPRPSFFLGIS